MVLNLVLVAVLVAANALFVAAEFSLVAVRRTRVQQLVDEGCPRAKIALSALGQLDLILSGCQLGITFASLGLGWAAEPVFATLLDEALGQAPEAVRSVVSHSVAAGIAFGMITYIHVSLGELVPKNLAIARPEQTALWTAPFIRSFSVAFRPVIWLFNATANRVLRIFGVTAVAENVQVHSSEELAMIVNESRDQGKMRDSQSAMVLRSLEFGNKVAADIVIPRTDLIAVPTSARRDEVLALVGDSGHARFPVFDESDDDYVGVVHIADLVASDRSAGDAMHEPLVVTEAASLHDVLGGMRHHGTHIAFVVDEFGLTAGMITRDDVLEEITGGIADEHDHRILARRTPRGVEVAASANLDEFREFTGVEILAGQYHTVAGYILDRLGRIAKPDDAVDLSDGSRLVVKAIDRNRIMTVEFIRAATRE